MTELRCIVEAAVEPPLETSGDATGHGALRVLSGLIALTHPKLVVEAGTFKGHFAIAAAASWEGTQVWTADIVRHMEWEEVTHEFKLADRIHFYEGDFTEMLHAHFTLGSVDFAYIDSGAAVGHTVNDDVRWQHYLAVKPYMAFGGLVAVHDTDSAAQWQHGSEIVAEASLVLRGDCGLALWQAP